MKNRVFIALTIGMGLVFGQTSYAETGQEEAIRKGHEHFKIFCTNCHGENADGRGPLAESMKLTPSDLTALNQTGGDICLAERVLKAIAGVHEAAAGQVQMPTFSGSLESITVYEITQYLKSIQK